MVTQDNKKSIRTQQTVQGLCRILKIKRNSTQDLINLIKQLNSLSGEQATTVMRDPNCNGHDLGVVFTLIKFSISTLINKTKQPIH